MIEKNYQAKANQDNWWVANYLPRQVHRILEEHGYNQISLATTFGDTHEKNTIHLYEGTTSQSGVVALYQKTLSYFGGPGEDDAHETDIRALFLQVGEKKVEELDQLILGTMEELRKRKSAPVFQI